MWAVIRAVTEFRVCWSGAFGMLSMMRGSGRACPVPPDEAGPDAPGCRSAGPGVVDEAAGRVRVVVHRAVFPYLHHAGLRFPRAVRKADGLWHAHRGRAVAAVAA